MKKPRPVIVAIILCLAGSLEGLATGPVTLAEKGNAVLLGNDYLERTLEVTEETLRTTRLWNKISGRMYALRGDEFELKLTYERLGYTFASENPLTLTTRDFRVVERSFAEVEGGGKRVTFHLAPRHSHQTGTGLEASVVYELKPEDFYTRQWLHLKTTGRGTYFIDSLAAAKNEWSPPNSFLGGFGQPLFTEDLFLGLEYPSSLNIAEGPTVTLGSVVGASIPPEGFTSEPAVIGVSRGGLVHATFMDYVRRMRVAPVRPYVVYNSWYDLQRLVMNHENTVQRVVQLDQALPKKYGLRLDSFVLDDGWDDMTNLWAIDPKRFPNGFRDLAAALRGAHSQLGLWFGPVGGYDQRQARISAGARQGMEITSNGEFLCLAGRNYSRFFRDTLLRLQKEYAVNFFKLDGIPFGCNQPEHGHPAGLASREADLRAFLDVLKAVRAQNPHVFLDITTSTWLSPWWLKYADTVWMGGEDYGRLESVPALTPRQNSMNYRDLVLYNDYKQHQVQFPMSSLTTQSVIKGKFLQLGGENESLDDWNDHLVNFFGVGSQLNELYITPELLKPEEWDSLGRSLRWAIRNAHPLLDNATFVLGDPARREPYGLVHTSPGKSILTLRNPFVRPSAVNLKLDEQAGFERADAALTAEVTFPFREVLPHALRYGETLSMEFGGYEQRVIELRPVLRDEARLEGVRYSVEPASKGEVGFHLYAPQGATATARLARASAYDEARLDGEKIELKTEDDQAILTLSFGKKSESRLTFSAPSIQIDGQERAARTLRVSLTVDVPADFQQSKLTLLFEPSREVTGVTADARANGKAVTLAVENGGRGFWCWFTTDLKTGSHTLDFEIHLPAEAQGSGRISGWLLAKRSLATKDLRLTFKPGQRLAAPAENLLPASSAVERKTYALFDQMVP